MIPDTKSPSPRLISARAGVEGVPHSINHPRAGVPFRRARQRQTASAAVTVTVAHLQVAEFKECKGGCCPNVAQ